MATRAPVRIRALISTCMPLVPALFLCVTCSPDYKDFANPQGRQLILDEANDFLTAGNCQGAIDVLTPLVESPYVDNGIRLVYSSAFACKGGMNVPNIIFALKDVSGSDIWTPLVKSNYSASLSDGKVASLLQSASIIRQTSVVASSFDAAYRSSDANVYMLLVQIEVIAEVLSPIGRASQATGKRTQGLCTNPVCTTADECNVEVAFATISNSLNYVQSSATIDRIRTSLSAACTAALGNCPTNKDPAVCTATEQAQGLALIAAIQTQWSL